MRIAVRTAVAVLAIGGAANAAVMTDNFEGYSTEELWGQAAAIGTGNWVATDHTIGGVQVSPTIAATGYDGSQGVHSTSDDHGAAFDLGMALSHGNRVSVYASLPSNGDEAHLFVATSAVADNGVIDDSDGFYVKLVNSAGDYNFARRSFQKEGTDQQVNGPNNVEVRGDWIEMEITVTTGDNGINGGSARYRNITTPFLNGLGGWVDIGTFTADEDGWGTGNTWISLSSWQNSDLDNLRFNNIPEPVTLTLLALGGVAALLKRRR